MVFIVGVTIATLTGENGILTRASDAAEQTEIAEEKEAIGVAYAGVLADNNGTGVTAGELQDELQKNGYSATVTDNGNGTYTVKFDESEREYTINADGTISGGTTGGSGDDTETGSLPSNEYSTPYLPGNEFSQVKGTNLETGLVVTDGTNYWTWIEVPTSIYTTAQSATDYEEIENDMETYTETLLDREECTDVWYDYCGTTYDGENEYSQVGYITISTNYNIAKEYYGTLYTDANGTVDETGSYVRGTTYYAKITEKLNDTSGCGLTYEGYNDLKERMLSSVYTNGGFWIGQYEAGSSVERTSSSQELTTPVIKQDEYPYNYITCSDAQIQASQINSGNYTSSLMFGIQWDLVLKYLQEHGATVEELTSNSTDWGNYREVSFTIDRGAYLTSSGASFTQVNGTYTKPANSEVFLTTGASTDRNVKMNKYDLAGNVPEMTLEKYASGNRPCAYRGGFYSVYGYSTPASSRNGSDPSNSSYSIGFRPAIY